MISDTHKNISKARRVIKNLESKVGLIIHLGDHVSDALDLSYEFDHIDFEYVAGNCDWSSGIPQEKIINIMGRQFLITHGHYYGVKLGLSTLIKTAKSKGVNGVLFGHTHVPISKMHDDIYLMNPGSLSMPRGGSGATYGTLQLDDEGKINYSIVPYSIYK